MGVRSGISRSSAILAPRGSIHLQRPSRHRERLRNFATKTHKTTYMLLFYLLISTMPFMSHPFWARYLGDFTATKYLGLGCTVYAAFYLFRRRTPLCILATTQAKCFGVFLLISLIAFAHGAPFTWKSQIVSYLSFALLFFATIAVVDSAYRLRCVLLACIGSVAWASLYLVREWQKSIPVYGIFYRPGWVTGDSNYFSAAAILVLPLCTVFVSNSGKRWERYYALSCGSVTLFAMAIGASRGGFLSLLIASLVMICTAKHRIRMLLGSIGIGMVMLVVLPTSPLRRLMNPSSGDESSSELRLQLWNAAARMTKAHPIAGVGLDNFANWANFYGLSSDVKQTVPHNTYLHIASEMGLPGSVGFIVLILASWHSLNRVRKRAKVAGPKLVGDAGRSLQAGLAGFSVAACFVSVQQSRFLWFILALSCSLPTMISKPRDTRGRDEMPHPHRKCNPLNTQMGNHRLYEQRSRHE